jgi:hypothetical protein
VIASRLFEAHPEARPALLEALAVKERVAIADFGTTRAMNIIFGSSHALWTDGQDELD